VTVTVLLEYLNIVLCRYCKGHGKVTIVVVVVGSTDYYKYCDMLWSFKGVSTRDTIVCYTP